MARDFTTSPTVQGAAIGGTGVQNTDTVRYSDATTLVRPTNHPAPILFIGPLKADGSVPSAVGPGDLHIEYDPAPPVTAWQHTMVAQTNPFYYPSVAFNGNGTETTTEAADAMNNLKGARIFACKLPWAVIMPSAPANPDVYAFSDFNFTTGPAQGLDAMLLACHNSPDAPKIKFGWQSGPHLPAWAYTSAAGTHKVNSTRKIQITAGANAVPTIFPTAVPWDPALLFWYDRGMRAFAQWMNTTCPYTSGSNTTTHLRSAHLWGVQNSPINLDNSIEMSESYEALPDTLATGAALKVALTTASTTVQTTIPIASITVASVVQTEGILRLQVGTNREHIYYTNAVSDGAGGTTFTVAPNSITGIGTGRGWSGGTNAGGFYSLPPSAWATSNTTVAVYDSFSNKMLGRPGSGNRATLTQENDPARSDGGNQTGLFPAGAWNQNNYARLGSLYPAVRPSYTRDAAGIPTLTGTLAPTSEANRRNIYARSIMDGIAVCLARFPAFNILQYGGQVWGGNGATVVGKTNPTVDDPLVAGTDYVADSPSNAVRDYLSLPFGSSVHAKVGFGHTDINVRTGSAWLSATHWKRVELQTYANRGRPLDLQNEAPGSMPDSDDYVATIEWGWATFGVAVRNWEASAPDRQNLTIGTNSPPTNGLITAPATSGIPAAGIAAFPGNSVSGTYKLAEYMFGYKIGATRTLSTNTTLATLGMDIRLRGWPTETGTGTVLRLAQLDETGKLVVTEVPNALAIPFTPVGTIAATNVGAAIAEVASEAGGGGAPTTADYLVGTTQAGLSAEIVVGATPGGELGGTWASPTVDATHSGSAHADKVDKATLDANSVLYAVTDDTPAALAMAASTILARLASGNVVAATPAQLKTLLAIVSGDISDFIEAAQDAIGALLADSATFDVTYNDAGNAESAAVLDSPKVGGITVTGTPGVGYILTAISGVAATWQSLAAASAVAPVSYMLNSSNVSTGVAPAGVVEFPGATRRIKADLTNATQARIVARPNGSIGASGKLALQYSTDESSWFYLSGTASGSAPSANDYVAYTAAATVASAFVNLQTAAKADCFWRSVTLDGDNTTSGGMGNIQLQVK